jgi:hypothetical protein
MADQVFKERHPLVLGCGGFWSRWEDFTFGTGAEARKMFGAF